MRKLIIAIIILLGCASSCLAQRTPVAFNFEKPIAGETYYLYNVGFKGFLCGGNLYNTQASLSKTSFWKVHVKPYNPEGEEWDGMTVLIEDSIETGYNDGCFRNVFVESNGLVYTDQVERTSNRDNVWYLKDCNKEKHTYNISLSMYNMVFTPESTSDFVLGYENNLRKQSPAVILCNPNGNVDNSEWGFIPEREFARKWDEHNLYMKAEELKVLIDSINKTFPIVNTNVAESVYLSPQSPREDILNQIGLMRAALYSQGKECSDISFTQLILNPNFDMGSSNTWRMRFNNISGSITWQGGLNSNYCAEAYQTVFDFNQHIEGIPNGVYRMDVQAYYRTRTPDLAWFERDTAYVATEIYANSFSRPVLNLMLNTLEDKNGQIDYLKEDGILKQALYGGDALTYRNIDGSYVPDNMSGESLVFQNGLYDQSLYFIVNDGTATIGIQQDCRRTGCWSAWDNFRLYYLGNSVDAYRSALNGKIASSKSLVTPSDILGLDNTHLKSALAEIDANIEKADISNLSSYMAKLQEEDAALRDEWKLHEFNDVKVIGGYDDKHDKSVRDKETAERDKYVDMANSTYNLARKSEDSHETAIQLFQKTIEFAKKDSIQGATRTKELVYLSNWRLGWAYKMLNDYVNAELSFKEADSMIVYLYNIEPNKYKNYRKFTLSSLADIYETTNRLDDAISWVNTLILLYPDDGYYYDFKGDILIRQGKNEEALAMWKKVLELNPDFLKENPNGTVLSNGLKNLGLIE